MAPIIGMGNPYRKEFPCGKSSPGGWGNKPGGNGGGAPAQEELPWGMGACPRGKNSPGGTGGVPAREALPWGNKRGAPVQEKSPWGDKQGAPCGRATRMDRFPLRKLGCAVKAVTPVFFFYPSSRRPTITATNFLSYRVEGADRL